MSVIAPDLVSVSYEPWYVKLLTYVAGSHNTLPTTNGQLYISPAWLSGYTSHQLIPQAVTGNLHTLQSLRGVNLD